MAKGKIKPLVAAWHGKDESWTFKRHEKEIKLQALELGRGEGKYLGLTPDDETTFELLEVITAKNKETVACDVLRPLSFKTRVIGYINNSVCRPLWRQATEKYSKDTKLTDTDKQTILENFTKLLNEEFDAEPGQFGRPKDSSYYARAAAKTKDKLVEYQKIGKDKLTDEQKLAVQAIVAEYKEQIAKSEELRKQEEQKAKADEAGLLDLLNGVEMPAPTVEPAITEDEANEESDET